MQNGEPVWHGYLYSFSIFLGVVCLLSGLTCEPLKAFGSSLGPVYDGRAEKRFDSVTMMIKKLADRPLLGADGWCYL